MFRLAGLHHRSSIVLPQPSHNKFGWLLQEYRIHLIFPEFIEQISSLFLHQKPMHLNGTSFFTLQLNLSID
jgi:hypothetical protein